MHDLTTLLALLSKVSVESSVTPRIFSTSLTVTLLPATVTLAGRVTRWSCCLVPKNATSDFVGLNSRPFAQYQCCSSDVQRARRWRLEPAGTVSEVIHRGCRAEFQLDTAKERLMADCIEGGRDIKADHHGNRSGVHTAEDVVNHFNQCCLCRLS